MQNSIIHTISRLAVITLTAMVLAACNNTHKYRIGVSQCSADDWRSKMNEEIMREAMLRDDIEIDIRSADDSNDKQIADLDYFVSNGFDIIIVAPNEADALTPKIKEIYESGKPVILFDRNIHGNTYTAFQGADNEEIGEMAASLTASLTSEPKILEIKGLKGSTPAELRHKGFRQAADSLGYRILGDGIGNWNYDDAKRVADSLLNLYPDANIIYAHNDRMAIAAKEVAKARGRNDIKIIGIDAAPNIGIQAVKDGVIDATFLYPTYGEQLVKTAIAILEGSKYDKNLILPTPAPVDISNAEILLLQDQALRSETEKIGLLQGKMDNFYRKYATQTTLLYGTIAILLLLAAFIFILLRYYWSSKRHRQQMEERNAALARQRDELDQLYHQLEDATGSKLAWFTNVSHDLRTPLTLIADPIQQMLDADNLTPRQHTLMQLANKNVKRLLRLVNQILDIRKYDNEQLKLNLANLNVKKCLYEWTASFAELARKHHIRFSANYLPDSEIVAAFDVEKIERVLFNLLSNAFKFTPENGSITITVDRVADNLICKISDTGIGIPPEEINDIFNRFFKTDQINPNGSGIGLALTKVFIEMHGGHISVESNVGEGSTFTSVMPIRTVDVDAATESPDYEMAELADVTPDEEVEVKEDTPTILVIDDNPDICTLVKTILSDGYTVISAYSGAQGIRLASRYLPDLIICDVMMPGTDGYEVCRSLKSEPLTSHIPILLLTACSRDEQRIEGYDCGADAYMSKPFDSDMLMARCKSLIANRKLIYQNIDANVPKASPDADKPAPQHPEVEDEFLQKFIRYVEDNMANASLSVETIAENLGLSRVQLYRKIKSTTNYSAVEMIRNIRLKHASRMLKTGSATVSEIAYAVGFSSPSYFSRCYKDYFNESPVDTQNRTSKKQ